MATAKQYLDRIVGKLKTFDKKGAEDICKELITDLYASDEKFDVKDTERIMQQLRNKRMFKVMLQVGDALIQTGRASYKLRKLYAQALIDLNVLTAAVAILNQLLIDTESAEHEDKSAKSENIEAKGLLGRAFKQLYVNADSPNASRSVQFIQTAIKYYLEVYITDKEKNTWHGINVVALLTRAKNDSIDISKLPSAKELATEVLVTIEHLDEPSAWDFATAGEACVALGRSKDALEWYSGYAQMPYCDAFEIASTLRQLEEVWKLNMNSETGKLILPLLRAELLKREGGCVIIDVADLQKQKASEEATTSTLSSMVKATPKGEVVLEKVFGDESFKTYKWYMLGADRCLAVARIGKDSSKGFGTGFLLKGKGLHEALGEELILITNAHVVSDDPAENSLRSSEAIIIFEALNRDEEFRVEEILFSSPSKELDATIIRFPKDDQERLSKLTKGVKIYPVSKHLPIVSTEGGSQRIYIIGHPFGGTLQLSFQDNILLDHEKPKIHYRTPTEGGSSGSPVFNQQWDLIGLHHAGSGQLRCLNGKPGTYEANEGMWIQSIIEKFAENFKG